MGTAEKVWGGMKPGIRGKGSGVRGLRMSALLLYSGLGGEPDYEQRFKMWAEDIESSLKKAGGDANIVTVVAPTRDQIRA